MASKGQQKKAKYDEKLCQMLEDYTKCFIVHADNVGSNQLMKIRKVREGKSPDGMKTLERASRHPPPLFASERGAPFEG